MKSDTKQHIRELAYYSSLGFQISFSVVIGFAAGYFLDDYFNTEPYLTYLFLAFGIAAGFRNIGLAIKRLQRDDAKKIKP
ncbi:MAG: AtpZ/AtpI family protein [Deltaproteobacteria bacterium]|nr:AtpZ/AtpI family protein [Deltaproteobacteria bacterium]